MHITLDIETLPAIDLSPEDRRALAVPPKNYKKPETIARWLDEHGEEAWLRTAFDPLQLRVLCVAWAVDDGPVRSVSAEYTPEMTAGQCDAAERGLVRLLDSSLRDACSHGDLPVFVGHNIAGFDLPALLLRAAKYRCSDLLRLLPRERYSKRVEDTMQQAAGPNPRPSWMRLDDLCRYLGIDGKPEGIDGSLVYQAWTEGQLPEIVAYCCHDVATTRKLWRAMRWQTHLTDED